MCSEPQCRVTITNSVYEEDMCHMVYAINEFNPSPRPQKYIAPASVEFSNRVKPVETSWHVGEANVTFQPRQESADGCDTKQGVLLDKRQGE
jgi:hypothetical protein